MDRLAGTATAPAAVADNAPGHAPADHDTDLDNDASAPIRIAHIGGRFLVFDVADVARLRRRHNLCAVLVGITPQAPNQCLFSGLPLQLTADEVRWLVSVRRAAVVVVDARARHLARLPLPDARRGFRAACDRQRAAVAAEVAAEAELRARRGADARARQAEKGAKAKTKAKTKASAADDSLPAARPPLPLLPPRLRITPTTSAGLGGDGPADARLSTAAVCGDGDGDDGRRSASPPAALRALLADRGFYTTPGLRFGGALSVYPGDPFRYHAHFVTMAPAAFARDAPVPLLDVVGTGRLATGVKKGLLLAGEVCGRDGDDGEDETTVRTFTLEWAAM